MSEQFWIHVIDTLAFALFIGVVGFIGYRITAKNGGNDGK